MGLQYIRFSEYKNMFRRIESVWYGSRISVVRFSVISALLVCVAHIIPSFWCWVAVLVVLYIRYVYVACNVQHDRCIYIWSADVVSSV